MGANHSDILFALLDGPWNSKFNEALNTSFAHIKNDLLTLMQCYKRTPNIFYASSSKSKKQSCILSIFINKPSLCRGSVKEISFQNDLYVLHG